MFVLSQPEGRRGPCSQFVCQYHLLDLSSPQLEEPFDSRSLLGGALVRDLQTGQNGHDTGSQPSSLSTAQDEISVNFPALQNHGCELLKRSETRNVTV